MAMWGSVLSGASLWQEEWWLSKLETTGKSISVRLVLSFKASKVETANSGDIRSSIACSVLQSKSRTGVRERRGEQGLGRDMRPRL